MSRERALEGLRVRREIQNRADPFTVVDLLRLANADQVLDGDDAGKVASIAYCSLSGAQQVLDERAYFHKGFLDCQPRITVIHVLVSFLLSGTTSGIMSACGWITC